MNADRTDATPKGAGLPEGHPLSVASLTSSYKPTMTSYKPGPTTYEGAGSGTILQYPVFTRDDMHRVFPFLPSFCGTARGPDARQVAPNVAHSSGNDSTPTTSRDRDVTPMSQHYETISAPSTPGSPDSGVSSSDASPGDPDTSLEEPSLCRDDPDTPGDPDNASPEDGDNCQFDKTATSDLGSSLDLTSSESPERGTSGSRTPTRPGSDAEPSPDQRAAGGANPDKPPHSYIALISMGILASGERKLVLSDIYQYIMDHFRYYRNQERAWRNSIRHNLSLNECFVKAGRAENGKGNYWAIHPACLADFSKGDYRRRHARRRARGAAFNDLHVPPPFSYYRYRYAGMTSSHPATGQGALPSFMSPIPSPAQPFQHPYLSPAAVFAPDLAGSPPGVALKPDARMAMPMSPELANQRQILHMVSSRDYRGLPMTAPPGGVPRNLCLPGARMRYTPYSLPETWRI